MAKKYTPAQNAWAFYDWANSVYSLVIATAVFPIYFESVTPDEISLGAFSFPNTSLYSYSLSFAFLVVALISPLLSGLADHTGNKLGFLKFFCYLGAAACLSLGFFYGEGTVWIALTGSILASIGFWGSLVFYNAFLPEIAPAEKHDALSARGFAWGYIGGALLLIINLLMIQFPEAFFLSDAGLASRVSFITVGLWWALFAQVTFTRLPARVGEKVSKKGYFFTGYRKLRQVVKDFKNMPYLSWYLLSFFTFSMGVQTVILMASLYGSSQLNLSSDLLIATILIIQFVAIGGAYLFAYLSRMIGNIPALMVAVGIWSFVCLAAYALNPEHPFIIVHFFLVGAVVGLVMGGIQSLSRSTYSKMLPETVNTASYFSFYDVTEKIAIVVGTLIFGLTIQLNDGDMKLSALMLGIFFLFALGFLVYLLKSIRPQDSIKSLVGQTFDRKQ
jgi:MFS transporter, UMF1 family